MTFLWVRHSARTAINSQLKTMGATSKCNLTGCKATGHLPCLFIDWDDWGQLTVLRGNPINYAPHGDWERLTTCCSNWKKKISEIEGDKEVEKERASPLRQSKCRELRKGNVWAKYLFEHVLGVCFTGLKYGLGCNMELWTVDNS